MSRVFELAYRTGLTPWESPSVRRAMLETGLLDRERAERDDVPGRALDLGCGTGGSTIALADRGWESVGIDDVERAITVARRRADAHRVRFIHGDARHLEANGIADIDFFLDVGCFHGMSDGDRRAYAASVTGAARPDATLLLIAFRPARRLVLPRGADRADIEDAFREWVVLDATPIDVRALPLGLRRTAPVAYRLRAPHR